MHVQIECPSRVDRHGAVLVGAEDLGADVAVALAARPAPGCPKWLLAAGADDRDAAARARVTNSGVLDVRLPWCGTLSDAQAAPAAIVGRSVALDRPADVAGQQRPTRRASAARARSNRRCGPSAAPSRRRADGARRPRRRRSTSAIAGVDVRPARARGLRRRRAARVSGSNARHRNPLPDLARPELPQHRRRRRRCDRDRRASARGSRAAGSRRRGAPARRRGRRCRTTTTPDSPPASTSIVEPRGKRTKVASPWPTSMNVTCSRPSPRAASERPRLGENPDRGGDGDRATPSADRARRRLATAAPATRRRHSSPRRRPRRRSRRRPPTHDGGATRQVSDRREADEIGRPDEARGADVRDPARQRRRAASTPAPPARPPSRRSARRPSAESPAKFSAEPGERHARERQRADREQHRLGRRRRREHRRHGRDATHAGAIARRRLRLESRERDRRHDGGWRAWRRR